MQSGGPFEQHPGSKVRSAAGQGRAARYPTGHLGGGRGGRGRRILAVVGAVVLVLALVGIGSCVADRSARTVAMLDVDAPGDDPFVAGLVQSGSAAPTVLFDAAATRTASGALDGLYLDTIGAAGCNRAPLAAALQGDPGLADAWGTPLGAAAPAVPALVATFTPLRLRADTRVTAHGYSGSRAEPYAATLRAGTAVLVDDRGMPRVRCADGAPLTGPLLVEDPYYGGAWDGFDPEAMVEIRPAAAAVVEFGLVDAAGEQPFRRPAGTTGAADVAALPGTGRLVGPYVFNGPPTRCVGVTCTPVDIGFVASLSGCPMACLLTEPTFGSGIPVTRDGTVWRANGNLPTDLSPRCVRNGNPIPLMFAATFAPTASGIVDGVWTATAVKADIEVRAAPSDGCLAGVVTWTLDSRPI